MYFTSKEVIVETLKSGLLALWVWGQGSISVPDYIIPTAAEKQVVESE